MACIPVPSLASPSSSDTGAGARLLFVLRLFQLFAVFKKSCILVFAILALFQNMAGQNADSLFSFFEYTQPLMGTEFRLKLYAADSLTAQQAADSAFQRIAELDKIFSDYREDSELSALNENAGSRQWTNASPELIYLTRLALSISKKTKGAFDISVGSLSKLWRRAFRQQQFPSAAEIKTAMKTTGYQHINVNRENTAIRLQKPGMRLDFGGIAKGYAADQAILELKKLGIHSALLDAGGDISVSNAPPGKKGWAIQYMIVGEKGPQTAIAFLENAGVATSGDTYRYLEWKGIRYSHIIDPHTGKGLTGHRKVTVFAPTCAEADAWATAVSVGISKRLRKKLEKRGLRVSSLEY